MTPSLRKALTTAQGQLKNTYGETFLRDNADLTDELMPAVKEVEDVCKKLRASRLLFNPGVDGKRAGAK